MKKKKILHIINLKGLGGIQKNFIDYYNNLQHQEKIEHYLICLDTDKDNLIKKNIFKFNKIKDFLNFTKILTSKNTLICTYNRIGSLRLLLLNIIFLFKKKVIHERGSIYNINSNFQKIILKINYFLSSKIITNSKATKYILLKKFNIINDKIEVVHNGFNLLYSQNQNFNKNKIFVVGFCGRFEQHKNPLKIIELAKKTIDDASIRYVLIGDGNLKNIIIEQSKMLKNITILDKNYNLDNFYREIDLLLVPSIREPFGNVIIEAGLHNKPVIASNVDGIPEIIKNNFNGILIDPKKELNFQKNKMHKFFPKYVINPKTFELDKPKELSTNDIFDQIMNLKHDQKLVSKLCSNMINVIINKFSIKNYIIKTNKIYRDL